MAKLKQLKQHDEIFYPITVGEAVIFKDGTDAEISEQEMNEIFGYNRNWINLVSTEDTDNFIEITSDSNNIYDNGNEYIYPL